jgi:hypothetical protein
MGEHAMKLWVAIDEAGNVISLNRAAAGGTSARPAGSRMSAAQSSGKILSLEVPRGLAGKPLSELHDSLRVDLSGTVPELKRKD